MTGAATVHEWIPPSWQAGGRPKLGQRIVCWKQQQLCSTEHSDADDSLLSQSGGHGRASPAAVQKARRDSYASETIFCSNPVALPHACARPIYGFRWDSVSCCWTTVGLPVDVEAAAVSRMVVEG